MEQVGNIIILYLIEGNVGGDFRLIERANI